ncbi:hypothetical protein ICE98_00752 [Lactococcus lactis]|nr:hypothetical protein [Lactococcus lactis]
MVYECKRIFEREITIEKRLYVPISIKSKIRFSPLNVVNLELEAQYYQEVLGMDILNQDETGVDLGSEKAQTKLIRLEKVRVMIQKLMVYIIWL